MTQTVVTVQCEWEIGVEGVVYGSLEAAKKDAHICLVNCDIEESLEELEDEGLIVFDEKQVVGEQRYCLVGDDSGHEYVVPVGREEDWNVWVEAADDSTDEPDYAERVEGGLTFTDPRE